MVATVLPWHYFTEVKFFFFEYSYFNNIRKAELTY